MDADRYHAEVMAQEQQLDYEFAEWLMSQPWRFNICNVDALTKAQENHHNFMEFLESRNGRERTSN